MGSVSRSGPRVYPWQPGNVRRRSSFGPRSEPYGDRVVLDDVRGEMRVAAAFVRLLGETPPKFGLCHTSADQWWGNE
jgi:hypothetical protein